MNKNITIVIMLAVNLLMAMLWLPKLFRPEAEILQKYEEIQDEIAERSQELHPAIIKLNEINRQIRSFSCENITLSNLDRGLKFRVKGKLFYRKNQDFRMILSSVFGVELDLGSNNDIFWYWSRRDSHPGLYFAKHEDYNKTRLKTPFNPIFFRESLGLNEIDISNAYVTEKNKDLMITTERTDSMGRQILYFIFVNLQTNKVFGTLITDMNGEPLASTEIKRYAGNLPLEIHYYWHEENKATQIIFENPEINSEPSFSLFNLPDYQPKNDMSLD